MMEELKKQIQELEKRVKDLEERRIGQQMIIPGAIKMRHLGEASKFVRAGTAANKPTTGETGTDSLAMYYDTTANKLWVFNGIWRSTTLT